MSPTEPCTMRSTARAFFEFLRHAASYQKANRHKRSLARSCVRVSTARCDGLDILETYVGPLEWTGATGKARLLGLFTSSMVCHRSARR